MQVHDGQVGPPSLCHILVCVQPYQQEVPLLLGFLHNKHLTCLKTVLLDQQGMKAVRYSLGRLY